MATGQRVELTIDPDVLFARPWSYPKSFKLWNVQNQAVSKQCQRSSAMKYSQRLRGNTHTQTNYYNPPPTCSG